MIIDKIASLELRCYKSRIWTLSFLAALCLIFLAACGNYRPDPTASDSPAAGSDLPPSIPELAPSLEDTQWRLTSQVDEKSTVHTILPGSEITLVFQDNLVDGASGCNRFTTSYLLDGEKIEFGEPAGSNLYCGSLDGIMQQERDFLSNIQSAASYAITNEQLTLSNLDGHVIATFTVDQSIALTDTKWQLIFYTYKNTLLPPIPGTEIFAKFSQDGSLIGSIGCNFYQSHFHTEGELIKIHEFSKTNEPCSEDPGVMNQEESYQSSLLLASTYQLNDKILSFYNAEGQLMLSFRAFAVP
jgi:heat shock protein HslJ